EAVTLAEEGLAVLRNEDRAAEVVHLDAGVQILLELGRQFLGPCRDVEFEGGQQGEGEGERADKGGGRLHVRAPRRIRSFGTGRYGVHRRHSDLRTGGGNVDGESPDEQ